METIPEIVLVDKPAGITSFDCIRVLRKRFGVRKMGHAGTLDPLASGLLIIGIGKGTKRMHDFLKLPKTYEASILLGKRTTTGDLDGDVLEEQSVKHLPDEEIKSALYSLAGVQRLSVPAYSAIKVAGRKLYEYARNNEPVDVPVKAMEIRTVTLQAIERQEDRCTVKAVFDVGSGTYIRSLAEELGRRLGVPATLAELRRTRIAEFSVTDPEVIRL